MGTRFNDALFAGFDGVFAWIKSDVLSWYRLDLWLAFFLAIALSVILWRVVRRVFF